MTQTTQEGQHRERMTPRKSRRKRRGRSASEVLNLKPEPKPEATTAPATPAAPARADEPVIQPRERTKRIKDEQGREHVYVVEPHCTRDGLLLKRRLADLFGVGGALVAEVFAGDGSATYVTVNLGWQQFLDLVCDGDFDIFDDILSNTTRDGVPVAEVFDDVYGANFLELYEALGFALEVNFGGLLKRTPFGQALSGEGLGETLRQFSARLGISIGASGSSSTPDSEASPTS